MFARLFSFSFNLTRQPSGGRIILITMVSGPARCPGAVLRCLVSACLLSLLLYLPEARASYYPQSGECKGKGKDCTGRKPAAAAWLCAPCTLQHPLSVPLCQMWTNQRARAVSTVEGFSSAPVHPIVFILGPLEPRGL